MKYREVANKLLKLGCQEIKRRSGGAHRKWYNSTNGKVVPVPDWGSKDIKKGTLRHIIRQLGLDWEEFKSA